MVLVGFSATAPNLGKGKRMLPLSGPPEFLPSVNAVSGFLGTGLRIQILKWLSASKRWKEFSIEKYFLPEL